jgi:hypothetical protein
MASELKHSSNTTQQLVPTSRTYPGMDKRRPSLSNHLGLLQHQKQPLIEWPVDLPILYKFKRRSVQVLACPTLGQSNCAARFWIEKRYSINRFLKPF